jgi:hypothetical protein
MGLIKTKELIYAELQDIKQVAVERRKLGENFTKEEADRYEALKILNEEAAEVTKKADQEIELYRAAHNKGVQDKRDKEAKEASDKRDKEAKEASDKRASQREKDSEAARLKLIEDAKALAEFEEEQARIKIQLIQDEGERKRAEIEYNSQLELEALEKKGTLTFDAEMLIAQKKHQALAEITKAEEEKKEAVRLAQIEFEKNLALKQLEAEKLLRDTKLQNDKDEEEIRRLAVEDEFQNKLATLEEQGLLTTELEIELMYSREQALFDIKEEFTEKERQSRLALNQERLESTTQVIGAIGSLNSAALANDLKNAGNNEALKERLRKESFEREKKLQLGIAAINGAQALVSIFAQYPKFDGGFAMIAALASSVITTASTIAKIKATSYQGGGSATTADAPTTASPNGAGAGGGGAQIAPVTNTSTILGNQQVFVTETDITDTQNNVSVIEESATF